MFSENYDPKEGSTDDESKAADVAEAPVSEELKEEPGDDDEGAGDDDDDE